MQLPHYVDAMYRVPTAFHCATAISPRAPFQPGAHVPMCLRLKNYHAGEISDVDTGLRKRGAPDGTPLIMNTDIYQSVFSIR